MTKFKNTGRDVQPPTQIDSTGPLKDETSWVHPAFGQIGVSRVQGRATLYGSDFEHDGYMVVRICESQLNRSLARDWHFGRKGIIEVALTESQWATFVSSPNVGSGVTCTIQHRDGEMVPGLPHRDGKDQFVSEGKKAMRDAKNALDLLIRDLKEGPLAGMSKAKQAEVLSKVVEAQRAIGDRLPFIENSFDEHVETRLEKAKQEIHGWMNATIQRAGLAAIAQREGQPLMLEGPDGSEDHQDR